MEILVSEAEFRNRFRSISDWCAIPAKRDYVGGWPNFEQSKKGEPARIAYGHHLLKATHLTSSDVSAEKLKHDSLRTMLTAAHDFARTEGYSHGFPNFHEALLSGQKHFGLLLVKKGSAVWVDAPADELELGDGNPTDKPLSDWFRGAHRFAKRRHYSAAMPNGNYAKKGSRWYCGVMMFAKDVVSFEDLRGSELDLPDLDPPLPPRPGVYLYSAKNYEGEVVRITGSTPDLTSRGFSQRMSSWRVVGDLSAIVFSERDYVGRRSTLEARVGDYAGCHDASSTLKPSAPYPISGLTVPFSGCIGEVGAKDAQSVGVTPREQNEYAVQLSWPRGVWVLNGGSAGRITYSFDPYGRFVRTVVSPSAASNVRGSWSGSWIPPFGANGLTLYDSYEFISGSAVSITNETYRFDLNENGPVRYFELTQQAVILRFEFQAA